MPRAQLPRQESIDICPICLQPIETDDEVVQAGERDLHAACYQEETVSSAETILSKPKPKPIPAPPKKAGKKRR